MYSADPEMGHGMQFMGKKRVALWRLFGTANGSRLPQRQESNDRTLG